MPNSVAYLIQTHIIEWYVVWCSSKNECQKDTCFDKDWIACSKYDKHSRLNSQLNWEDLYDYLMSTQISTLIMNKVFA